MEHDPWFDVKIVRVYGSIYPDSFIGKKVRNHWEKGCISHNAYVEVYGSDELSSKKSDEKSNNT